MRKYYHRSRPSIGEELDVFRRDEDGKRRQPPDNREYRLTPLNCALHTTGVGYSLLVRGPHLLILQLAIFPRRGGMPAGRVVQEPLQAAAIVRGGLLVEQGRRAVQEGHDLVAVLGADEARGAPEHLVGAAAHVQPLEGRLPRVRRERLHERHRVRHDLQAGEGHVVGVPAAQARHVAPLRLEAHGQVVGLQRHELVPLGLRRAAAAALVPQVQRRAREYDVQQGAAVAERHLRHRVRPQPHYGRRLRRREDLRHLGLLVVEEAQLPQTPLARLREVEVILGGGGGVVAAVARGRRARVEGGGDVKVIRRRPSRRRRRRRRRSYSYYPRPRAALRRVRARRVAQCAVVRKHRDILPVEIAPR